MTRRTRTSATTSSRAPRLTRHPTRQRSTRCAPSWTSCSASADERLLHTRHAARTCRSVGLLKGPAALSASKRTLRLSDPVAQPLEQPREGGVLLHLYAQMAHARVVERLAASVVDLELARAE